jgi:hypothetical protein
MGKQEEQATIPGSEFFKSLGKLEALAKGQDPEDLEKAQLFHTSSSERREWPGGKKHDIGNKWDDSIGTDGTDYKEARKSVADKVLKGEPLTADDIALLKSDAEAAEKSMAKGEGQEVEDGGGKGAPGKEGQEVGKSLAEENDTLQKGIEMSPFLAEMVKAIDSRFQMVEQRQNDQVVKAANGILENLGEYLESRFATQEEFNKSLAEVVSGIGHGLHANIQQTAEMAQAPAGAPKSTLRAVDGGVQPIEKSFGGEPGGGEDIQKSQVLSAMTDMVEKGNLNPLEVTKYETTNQIRPDLLQKITADIKAAGNGQ